MPKNNNKISDNDFYKALLVFISYGKESTIKDVTKNFDIYCFNYNREEAIRETFFRCLITRKRMNNNNEIDLQENIDNFYNFFETVLKTINHFKRKQTSDKKYADFLSMVIDLAFKQEYLYEIDLSSKQIPSFNIYELKKLKKGENIVIKIQKKQFMWMKASLQDQKLYFTAQGISLKNFVNVSPKSKLSDFKRFKDVIDKINTIYNPKAKDFCPFCNPTGIKRKKHQGCDNCKALFNRTKQFFENYSSESDTSKKSIKRIKDNVSKSKVQGMSYDDCKKKRLEVFITSLDREYKSTFCTEKLKNVTELTKELDEIKKDAERTFLADTSDYKYN